MDLISSQVLTIDALGQAWQAGNPNYVQPPFDFCELRLQNTDSNNTELWYGLGKDSTLVWVFKVGV